MQPLGSVRSVISPFMTRLTAHHRSMTRPRLGILDRPRRHVHGRRRAHAGRESCKTLKLLRSIPSATTTQPSRASSGCSPVAPDDGAPIVAVKMGTTVATNALLERRGEPTVLVITAGSRTQFASAASSGPNLRARHRSCPRCCIRASSAPTSASTARARARAARHGEAAPETSRPRTRRDSTASRSCCCTAIVIRSTRSRRPRSRAQSGSSRCRCRIACCRCRSSSLRGDTTLADAYLSPVLDRYVASVRRGLARIRRMRHKRRCTSCRATAACGRGAFSRQGQPALGAGRRRDRHGARRARRRDATKSSASTWAARRRMSRCTPASSSARRTP